MSTQVMALFIVFCDVRDLCSRRHNLLFSVMKGKAILIKKKMEKCDEYASDCIIHCSL